MSESEPLIYRLRRNYLQLPLRKKLTLAIVGASISILLFAVLALFLVELGQFRKQLLNEYRTIAKMLASNLEAAVVFEDETDSLDVLSVMMQRSSIEVGVLYLEDGRVLAVFEREGSRGGFDLPDFEAESSIGEGRIIVNEPVVVDGRIAGRVALHANLDEINHYLMSRGLVSLLFIAITVAIALFLGNRLGDLLSRPILQLAETAQRVAKDNDFSTRQEKSSDDETGLLVDAFNEMLAEIEKQNERVTSNEARFRGYFESGIVGAGILDTSLVWKEANSRMTELLGRDEGSLLGLSLSDVIEDPFPGVPPEKIRTKVELGTTQDCWVRETEAEVERRYVRISLRCIPGTKSHEEHVLILVSDITDRKLHEEEILREKERAESLSKAKDEFLSVISHELRTPLNPIIGYVEMLKLKSSGKTLEQLDLVHESAVHLLGLINDVLDFSRIEQGPGSLFLEWLDYREVCESVVELLEPEARGKGIDLKYRDLGSGGSAESGVFVRIDGKRIRQVLFNLVGNALKFTHRGEVIIRSRIERTRLDRGVLRIEVEDTGIGIDSSKWQFVFDPFSQVDTSLSREHDGLGLGLAISRKIINAMEGRIDLRSEPGQGSCFWFEIPVEASTVSRGKIAMPEEVKRQVRKGGKVLLVEDDAVNCEMALAMLKELGQTAHWAADGEEALKLMDSHDFDMVFMDIMMPRMSGLEAAEAIRSLDGARARIPIVAVTAHVGDDYQNSYHEKGFDEYLSKPYTMEKLAACLSRWIAS